ncbi:cell division protein CrgA [Microbacterium sp. ARD31]|uniref:cell division protein CrgA n=1 Tax=Microbacterium sp. ARD31 TaxID=2962576 RepID=UPI002881D178|nr:cell division protein CrgA [Microbacterium sp. ARD31]MDT0185890.1 cell division protein CrgA [Microbacterium sp. ARD31]
MSKSKTDVPSEKASLLSARFVIALLLIVAGIAWLAYYYVGPRGNPLAFPPVEGKPQAVADLGKWNYAIGFGVLMLGLMVSAHPSTPLGRGRGVVVGMLACFLIGLLWICTFYVFSDDLSKLWIFNDLGQWNLVVGIAFMAVGFSFATKWE